MPPGKDSSSPEFELVLACVCWPITQAGSARIVELAQKRIDWPHLLNIANHHQVVSLVAHNLETCAAGWMPPEALKTLQAGALENARISFQGISELVRLTRIFRERQIDLRVFKGAPLSMLAFGDPTIRGVGDLDLLVNETDLRAADQILSSEGYLRCEPVTWSTPRRMRSYLAHQKDFSYEHPRSGIAIDLHWRLFRNRQLQANACLEEAGLAWTQLGSERIPTLPASRLFLYLCVHGALDGWLRLKWLADIAALLRASSHEELRSLAQAAQDQNVLPEFSAAILLCHQRLGFEDVPAECLTAQNPTVARSLRFANRLMTSNDFCPVREKIPSTAWFLNEFFLDPSLASRIEIIERSLFRPRIWEKVNLPDALFPLYALLSPLEWVGFRLARWRSRISSRLAGRGDSSRAGRRPARHLLLRFFRLRPSDFALLIEAMSMLLFFRAALRFFPVQRLTLWMGGSNQSPPAPQEEHARQTLRRVEWAVGAIVRHAPLTFVCFPQSLAAYFMLRRRHIPSRLFYGVAREQQQLKAHTWIKAGDRTVVGGESEAQFTVLAIFP